MFQPIENVSEGREVKRFIKIAHLRMFSWQIFLENIYTPLNEGFGNYFFTFENKKILPKNVNIKSE